MKQTRRQFVRTLFVATQATVIGSMLPRSLFAADAKAGGLNFLVFGDWGRNGEQDQMEVAAQMAIAAKDIDAKFIISVGDNFYENGVASVDDPQWQTSFEKVYSAPSLQVPWHVIAGQSRLSRRLRRADRLRQNQPALEDARALLHADGED